MFSQNNSPIVLYSYESRKMYYILMNQEKEYNTFEFLKGYEVIKLSIL